MERNTKRNNKSKKEKTKTLRKTRKKCRTAFEKEVTKIGLNRIRNNKSNNSEANQNLTKCRLTLKTGLFANGKQSRMVARTISAPANDDGMMNKEFKARVESDLSKIIQLSNATNMEDNVSVVNNFSDGDGIEPMDYIAKHHYVPTNTKKCSLINLTEESGEDNVLKLWKSSNRPDLSQKDGNLFTLSPIENNCTDMLLKDLQPTINNAEVLNFGLESALFKAIVNEKEPFCTTKYYIHGLFKDVCRSDGMARKFKIYVDKLFKNFTIDTDNQKKRQENFRNIYSGYTRKVQRKNEQRDRFALASINSYAFKQRTTEITYWTTQQSSLLDSSMTMTSDNSQPAQYLNQREPYNSFANIQTEPWFHKSECQHVNDIGLSNDNFTTLEMNTSPDALKEIKNAETPEFTYIRKKIF